MRFKNIKLKLNTSILWLSLIPLSIYFVTHYQFSWNRTESLPQKLFIIANAKLPTKGDYVLFYAPNTSELKPTDTIIKQVKGMAGDIVNNQGQVFYINGEKIGIAKLYSLKGRALLPGLIGVITKGKYFVWTPHVDSYDSRYAEIGWIDEKNIIGVAYPIF